MNIINLLKKTLTVLFTVIIGLHSTAAASADRPIITLSFGKPYSSPITSKCYPAYIIKIFENAHVEYQGVNKIKVLGKREYQMDKATLKALIKKFQDANFMTADERVSLPMVVRENRQVAIIGIRFRQGNQEATIFDNFPLPKLKSEIIRATKAERWGVNEVSFCPGGIK